MPTYIYQDDKGHKREVIHGMTKSPRVDCDICGAEMRRVPQLTLINWGAFRRELHPNIRNLIETAPERRDKFAQEHEEHERRTAAEIRG